MSIPKHIQQTIDDLEQKAHKLEGLAVSSRLMANNLRAVFDGQDGERPLPATIPDPPEITVAEIPAGKPEQMPDITERI
jgi:hypothetical protein